MEKGGQRDSNRWSGKRWSVIREGWSGERGGCNKGRVEWGERGV